MRTLILACSVILLLTSVALAQNEPQLQLVQPQGPGAPPPVMTLQDALERAKTLDVQVQAAITEAQIAREDVFQARSSLLPTLNNSTQYLGTQGNGTLPSGRFVSNDGVHVYREWGIVHQEFNADLVLGTSRERAAAAAALARAKVEVAQRGLTVTVTKNYYALVTAQRKYATVQTSVQQAMTFLEQTRQRERAGEVAHSDTVKAEIQYEQQRNSFQEAALAMSNARLNLAVLLFPTLNLNFTVVDDLDNARILPAFTEIQSLAERENPDLRAAEQALRAAGAEVKIAKNASYPTLSFDGIYGIEANAFALHSTAAAAPEAGVLPNLGYFITANLTIPIFDWGTRRSKVVQAKTREQQARVELSQTQRQLVTNLYLYYNEAMVARGSVDNLRRTADLAAESLRLINLRYGAGESTALEVVDAQRSLLDARNAYDDAQTRYRVALATLQTLTGIF